MHLDELRSHLADAVDAEPGADLTAGRQAIDRRVRRHQTRRIGAVATVVVVLLGTVGLRLSQFGRSDTLPVISGPSTAQHLVPTAQPDGVTFSGMANLPISARLGMPTEGPARTFIYATGTGPDAVDGESFAVLLVRFDLDKVANLLRDLPRSGSSPGSTSPATADPGTIAPGSIDLSQFVKQRIDIGGPDPGVNATRGNDWVALVVSRSLPTSTLQSIADSIRPSADRSSLDAIEAPPGFHPAGGSTSLGVLEDTSIVSLLAEGTMTGYNDDHSGTTRSGSRSAFIAVVALPGHADDLTGLRWFLQDEAPLSLHGRDGIGGTFVAGTYRTSSSSTASIGTDGQPQPTSPPGTTPEIEIRQSVVAWVEPDGTLMVIEANGYSVAELRDIADGLRTVDDAEWHRLLATPTTLPPGCVANADGGSTCTFAATGTSIAGSVPPPTAP